MGHITPKIKTALSLIRTPQKMLLPAGQNGLLNFVPDEIYIKIIFNAEMGYRLNQGIYFRKDRRQVSYSADRNVQKSGRHSME